MSPDSHGTVAIRAPAKLNLGLEILGKRQDGLHEIRTVMTMLDLGDDMFISSASRTTVHGVPGVAHDTNLISLAINAFTSATGIDVRVDVAVTKRIPVAAGLGGASADAAGMLCALNYLTGLPLSPACLLSLAAALGSDVPFFLGSPLALSSGTGTDLITLEPVPFEVFLIDPAVTIQNKTSNLYGMLEKQDFSDGTRIQVAASSLRASIVPPGEVLPNAFERPLFGFHPQLRELRETLDTIDSLAVGMTGAGPVQYVIPLPNRVEETDQELRTRLPSHMTVIRTRSRLVPLDIESRASSGLTHR